MSLVKYITPVSRMVQKDGGYIAPNVQGLLAVVEFEKLLLGKLGEADR